MERMIPEIDKIVNFYPLLIHPGSSASMRSIVAQYNQDMSFFCKDISKAGSLRTAFTRYYRDLYLLANVENYLPKVTESVIFISKINYRKKLLSTYHFSMAKTNEEGGFARLSGYWLDTPLFGIPLSDLYEKTTNDSRACSCTT